MSLASGTRLGPHEVVGLIGEGGTGEVYEARDTRLDLTVAIKVLPSELSADAERRARFEYDPPPFTSLASRRAATTSHPMGSGSAGAGSGVLRRSHPSPKSV